MKSQERPPSCQRALPFPQGRARLRRRRRSSGKCAHPRVWNGSDSFTTESHGGRARMGSTTWKTLLVTGANGKMKRVCHIGFTGRPMSGSSQRDHKFARIAVFSFVGAGAGSASNMPASSDGLAKTTNSLMNSLQYLGCNGEAKQEHPIGITARLMSGVSC